MWFIAGRYSAHPSLQLSHCYDFSYTITHKTEYIKNTLNPKWKQFTVPVRALCNGDYDRGIKIECYDWNSNGSHDIIGSCQTNMRELSRGAGSKFEVRVNVK